MIECPPKEDEGTGLEAQYLVCQRLVRACRQALYELALDEEGEPAIRRMAIQAMKDILGDWSQAQKDLRRELALRGNTFTVR